MKNKKPPVLEPSRGPRKTRQVARRKQREYREACKLLDLQSEGSCSCQI